MPVLPIFVSGLLQAGDAFAIDIFNFYDWLVGYLKGVQAIRFQSLILCLLKSLFKLKTLKS